MIKDEAFYVAIDRAAKSLARKTGSQPLCSSVSELERCVDVYLETGNYMRTGLIIGTTGEMVSHRMRRLREMGIKIEVPKRGEPLRLLAEEMARMYSDGFNYQQIAEFYNIDRSSVGNRLRELRELGFVTVDDDKRERAHLVRCCAEHLADLYRYHGNRVRAEAA